LNVFFESLDILFFSYHGPEYKTCAWFHGQKLYSLGSGRANQKYRAKILKEKLHWFNIKPRSNTLFYVETL